MGSLILSVSAHRPTGRLSEPVGRNDKKHASEHVFFVSGTSVLLSALVLLLLNRDPSHRNERLIAVSASKSCTVSLKKGIWRIQ